MRDLQLGIVMKKNWVVSVDQCQLQALQFLVRLIDLLSILLGCNGFTRIQKAVLVQTGSRLTSSDHDLFFFFFFWCKFGFGKCFGASSGSNHWAGHHWLSYKIYLSLHVTIWSRKGLLLLQDDTTEWCFFLICGQLMWHHLLSFFTFPICFKCQLPIAWLTLNSLATSHFVVRRSA